MPKRVDPAGSRPDRSGQRRPSSAGEASDGEVQPTTKADEIVHAIEEMIVAGKLPPGRVLRQDELSHRFGVSRTPIREALRQLAALGLVTFVPNRGVRVRGLDQDEWGQAFLARAALESAAAFRAATRLSPEDLASIDRANDDFQRETARLRDPALRGERRERTSYAWTAANDRFHQAIVAAAGAPLLERLVGGLRRVFSGEALWAPGSAADRLYEVNVRQHDAIRYALVAGSADSARTLMYEHVMDSWSMLQEVLAEASSREP